MKASRIAVLALLALMLIGVSVGRAEDQAPVAAPPAEAAPQVLEPLGGCMPDGGCCGHGACAHAAAAADKPANGGTTGAADSNAADTGGCPCARMKKKAM